MEDVLVASTDADLIAIAAQHGPDAERAKEVLLDRYEPLFRSISWRLRTAPRDWEDAMQGARLGFLEAISSFDLSRGTSLGYYARGFIYKRVLEATFRTRRKRDEDEEEPNETMRTAGVSVATEDEGIAAVDRQHERDVVNGFLRSLPRAQRTVAVRVLIDGEAPTKVAAERGVSPQAICKLRDKVLEKGRVALADLHKEAAA